MAGLINCYNFFIDDNIIFLLELVEQQADSLFDHFYLRGLKRLNEQYRATFTLNLFYTDEAISKLFTADF